MRRVGMTLAVLLAIVSVVRAQTPETHRIVEFDVPGAGHNEGQGTIGKAIAADGTIAGFYIDSNATTHGFLRSAAGEFTTFDPLGSVATYPHALNSTHAVVGQYVDSKNVEHGFLRSADGVIVTFDAPRAGKNPDQGTSLVDIATNESIVGYYLDHSSAYHGFLITRGVKFTEFDAPGAGTGAFQGTTTAGLNYRGEVGGSYVDSNSFSHGFVRAPNGTFTEFDPQGSLGTYPASTRKEQLREFTFPQVGWAPALYELRMDK